MHEELSGFLQWVWAQPSNDEIPASFGSPALQQTQRKHLRQAEVSHCSAGGEQTITFDAAAREKSTM